MSETPRRPGRPPLDPHDPSVPVAVRLPSRQYDDLLQRAQRERSTVADLIRRSLQPRDDDD